MRGTVACSTDHRLVRSVMKIYLAPKHRGLQRPARRSSTSKPSKTQTKEPNFKNVSPLDFLISLQLTSMLNSSGMHLSQPSTTLLLRQSATPHASTNAGLTRTMGRFKTSLNARERPSARGNMTLPLSRSRRITNTSKLRSNGRYVTLKTSGKRKPKRSKALLTNMT